MAAVQRSASAAAEGENLDKREDAHLIPARKMAPIQRSAARVVRRQPMLFTSVSSWSASCFLVRQTVGIQSFQEGAKRSLFDLVRASEGLYAPR